MKSLFYLSMFLFVLLSFVGFTKAATFHSDENVTLTEPTQDDIFVSGKAIQITAPVNGELFAAGKTVTISSPAKRSVLAGGDTVSIEGSGYNVFVAGNSIILKGTIEHDVYAFGQSLTLDGNTHIKGSLHFSGGDLILKGKIDGNIDFSAAKAEIDATIGGNVKADASTLVFSDAIIGGNLTYTADTKIEGLDKVTVGGKIDSLPGHKTGVPERLGQALLTFLTSFVAGAALLLIAPKKIQAIHQLISSQWKRSFLVGLGTCILAPFVLLFIASSRIGLPIALIGGGLYITLLYFSGIMTAMLIGYRFLMASKSRVINWWLALGLGLLILSVLKLVPVLGPILMLSAFLGLTIPIFGATLQWWKEKLA
jgi:hypothetical protein